MRRTYELCLNILIVHSVLNDFVPFFRAISLLTFFLSVFGGIHCVLSPYLLVPIYTSAAQNFNSLHLP